MWPRPPCALMSIYGLPDGKTPLSCKLIAIPFGDLERYHHLWFPFVRDIAKRQRCYVEQRLAEIYSGSISLILIWDEEKKEARALIGYSIKQRGPDKVFTLVWMSGPGRRDYSHLHDTLARWAREAGCKGMEAVARPGWSPELK